MFQMKFDDIEEARERVLTDKVTALPLSTQALYLHQRNTLRPKDFEYQSLGQSNWSIGRRHTATNG